jgi:carbamoyltransferase
VALNCVANGRVLREGPFDRLWIQPAAGDAGGVLGAALAHWHGHLGNARTPQAGDSQQGSYLGPAASDAEIVQSLDRMGAVHHALPEDALCEAIAEELAAGRIVGHVWGRAEFGPRALGHRSILGDPRDATMQRRMNVAIKFRESFRPFAPAVLAGRQSEWFDLQVESPYMLLVAPVARRHWREADAQGAQGIALLNQVRSSVPAITHVDRSARVQTVDPATSPRFAAILRAFDRRTGCPVLVNTSFNIRGEPIVNDAADAYRCFMFTDMDTLVVGDRLMRKSEQPPMEGAEAYKRSFKLD